MLVSRRNFDSIACSHFIPSLRLHLLQSSLGCRRGCRRRRLRLDATMATTRLLCLLVVAISSLSLASVARRSPQSSWRVSLSLSLPLSFASSLSFACSLSLLTSRGSKWKPNWLSLNSRRLPMQFAACLHYCLHHQLTQPPTYARWLAGSQRNVA